MDINLLVLSAGNSRVAMGVFEAGELTYVTRIAHEQRADWAGRIAEAWERINGKDNAAIAGASVNPVIMEALEHVVQETTGQRVEWVGRELDVPIKVRTENPKETGVDRVLSVAAAYEQLGKACVVVDAGTAVTVNLCNDAGEFLGGAIAPCAKLMLDALHEKTARLPRVEFAPPAGPYGRNTVEAMRVGAFHGIRGMVRDVVENYATEIGTWPELIATGGDAAELFEGWELVHAISPNLVLYGIALAYANHHIQHGT
jgi:type III pantothenate kinase